MPIFLSTPFLSTSFNFRTLFLLNFPQRTTCFRNIASSLPKIFSWILIRTICWPLLDPDDTASKSFCLINSCQLLIYSQEQKFNILKMQILFLIFQNFQYSIPSLSRYLTSNFRPSNFIEPRVIACTNPNLLSTNLLQLVRTQTPSYTLNFSATSVCTLYTRT